MPRFLLRPVLAIGLLASALFVGLFTSSTGSNAAQSDASCNPSDQAVDVAGGLNIVSSGTGTYASLTGGRISWAMTAVVTGNQDSGPSSMTGRLTIKVQDNFVGTSTFVSDCIDEADTWNTDYGYGAQTGQAGSFGGIYEGWLSGPTGSFYVAVAFDYHVNSPTALWDLTFFSAADSCDAVVSLYGTGGSHSLATPARRGRYTNSFYECP